MILKELVEFAKGLPDLPPPGYQPALITKCIRLHKDGSLRDVISLSGDKRGKRDGKHFFVPREQPQRTVGTVPRLIADNVNYVLGLKREKDKPDQVQHRHLAYLDLLRECAIVTGDEFVKAILSWFESGGPQKVIDKYSFEDEDDLTFEVDGEYPTDKQPIRDFWANHLKSEHSGVCLLTGVEGPIIDRMPVPIKGIPEGQMSGTALVSVNNQSGESHGLKAALNSPINAAVAESLCNGLNYLLASEKHSLRIGKVVYVYWMRDARDSGGFSWDILEKPSEEDVKKLLESVHRGRQPVGVEAKDFFVLALSANSARIVVRDHYELTLSSVQAKLAEWFQKIAIVSQDGQPAKPFGLFRLAASLFREAKDVPVHVPTDLLRSALTGLPLPDYLLGLAVKRNLAMQGPFSSFGGKRYLCGERLAIIKTILEQKEEIPLTSLNTNHPDPAYHCGRLLAILEQIQKAALGDINATVVDRYYGAACASPGTILGNLVNDAQAHLAKMRKGGGDGWAQNKLAEVLSAIGDHFPKTLSLERQGLFALGYYHQRADDKARAIEAKEKKNATQE